MNAAHRTSTWLRLGLIAVAATAGCDRPVEGPSASPKRAEPTAPAPSATTPAGLPPRAGISELEPGATLPTAAGQSIYVPIHARVAAEDGRPIRLAVNVAVRNADDTRPILVTVLRHRDADGKTVRDYLRAPARLAPRATLDVLLKDPDAAAPAPAASVLVEWVADRAVAPPIVEAVMIGTTGGQGISFAERGQVIEDRQRPGNPPR
jgi:hypothetical protein